MTDDRGETANIVQLFERAVAMEKRGDGGDNGDMDARIAKLEGKVDRLGEDTAAIKAVLGKLTDKIDGLIKDVAEAKGRLNAMPSSWQLIGLIIAVFGLAFALIKVTAP